MSERINISSSAKWEDIVGYSRAVRIGNIVEVAGTSAVDEQGNVVGIGDMYEQTRFILAKIERVLDQAGAGMADVIRTRMYVIDIGQWQAFARAHNEYFSAARPAATAIEVRGLIHPDLMIEIEATAIVSGD